MAYDLEIRNGTIIDPSQGLSRTGTLAVEDGRIAGILESDSETEPKTTIDAGGCLVVPGLIDMHTHIYWGANLLSIMADDHMAGTGTTTWVDAGTSGGANFAGFRRFIIEPSMARIVSFLNISYPGLVSAEAVCHKDVEFMDVDLVVETVEANRDVIRGIKVLASRFKVGSSDLTPVRLAREAGDATGLPVMCHIGLPPPGLRAILPIMRPDDIITHTYKGRKGCLLIAGNRVRPEAREARERGVLFDVGHGAGSFSWAAVRAALDQDFPPDSISTDLYAASVEGPAFSMPAVMSKFLHLGMDLAEIIGLATSKPAEMLGMSGEIGTLRTGACADICVLKLEEGEFPAPDCEGVTENMERRLVVKATVRGGVVQKAPQSA